MNVTRVRVESFTISLVGFGAGPSQDIANPLGVGGADLHQWAWPTRTFQRALFGANGGTTGIDDEYAARGFENIGAWILGRNMSLEYQACDQTGTGQRNLVPFWRGIASEPSFT